MAASKFDPSSYPALTADEALIVQQIFTFTQEYFKNPKFDSSHDFNHVMRVAATAVHILEQEQKSIAEQEHSPKPKWSAFIVILGALLHDVEDKKYVDTPNQGVPLAKQELLRLGLSEDDAQRIQTLVEGVSYSTECKNPMRTKALIEQIPELAIVQDADRLDAIGAIGIARCFTFGSAKHARKLEHSFEHIAESLLKREAMMKTSTGRGLAAERTRRLREFMGWWDDEVNLHSH